MNAATPAGRPLARPRRSHAKYWLGLAVIVGAVAYMLYGSLGTNLVFFITPSEWARDRARYAGRTVRLGGLVKPGTVRIDRNTLEVDFVLTDAVMDVPVVHRGAPPSLFKAGQGVTVEGKFGPDGVFQGDTLLVKHSEEYRAPKPGETIDPRMIKDAR